MINTKKLFSLSKNEALLFFAGMNLIFLNFIMVQHISVAFRQLEMAVMVFSLAYFVGITLGYFVSDLISEKFIRNIALPYILLQMVILVMVQAAVYSLRNFAEHFVRGFDFSKGFGQWSAYIVAFVVLVLCSTSLYAVFLPSVIETENKNIKRFYSIEIIGSLAALLIVPFAATCGHKTLLACYLLSFLIMVRLIGGGTRLLCAIFLSSVFFIRYYDSMDKHYAAWFYKQFYSGRGIQKVIYTRYTPYHKIEVLKMKKNRKMLVLNAKKQFAHSSHYNYSYFIAEYPARLLGGNSNVCLFGAGSMSSIGRIGDISSSITIVELDTEVYNTSARFFKKYNQIDKWLEKGIINYISDDAKHFMGSSSEKFDLIIDDIPPANSRQTALTYTEEFYKQVKAHLSPKGMFSMPSLTPFNSKRHYGEKIVATMAHVFDNYFLLLYKNSVYFFGGGQGMEQFTREQIRAGIKHKNADQVKILLKDEIDGIVKGVNIITINNMADLIYG